MLFICVARLLGNQRQVGTSSRSVEADLSLRRCGMLATPVNDDAKYGAAEPCSVRYVSIATLNVIDDDSVTINDVCVSLCVCVSDMSWLTVSSAESRDSKSSHPSSVTTAASLTPSRQDHSDSLPVNSVSVDDDQPAS